MLSNVEVVLFAIQAGIKLGQQARLGYIEATKSSTLVLPFLSFSPAPTVLDALAYLIECRGNGVSLPPKCIAALDHYQTARRVDALSADEIREVQASANECILQEWWEKTGSLPGASGHEVGASGVTAIVEIRQWGRGDQSTQPTMLQRIAGTLVEIAVDYFASGPGGASLQATREGKYLLAVLKGIDRVSFVEPLRDLPQRMLISVLEAAAENPSLFTDDDRARDLVAVSVQTLANDVNARFAAIGQTNDSEKEQVADWAQVVFTSILKSGREVVADPKRYLGIEGDGRASLVQEVGTATLDMVLSQPRPLRGSLFSQTSLDTIIKAALKAVGDHPDLFGRSDGKKPLGQLLSALARDLGKFDTVLHPGITTEIIRLVLERTGENLPLLWPDAAQAPERHLLLTATQTIIEAMTEEPQPGAHWTPRFGTADIVAVADAVLAELAAEPQWLLDAAGGADYALAAAVAALIDTLRAKGDQPVATRLLSPATARAVVIAAVRSAGNRPEILDVLGPSDSAIGIAALNTLLDIVFDPATPRKATWRLMGSDTLVAVAEAIYHVLERAKLDAASIGKLRTGLVVEIAVIAAGDPWSVADLEVRLRAAMA